MKDFLILPVLLLCAINSIHSYVHSNLGQKTNQQKKESQKKTKREEKKNVQSKKIEKSSNQTIYFSFKKYN